MLHEALDALRAIADHDVPREAATTDANGGNRAGTVLDASSLAADHCP
ncbi:hypothetical protein [Phytomonospora endophytica]|uniref:Uncharacterized protein n=1 Tax=Phytomonospora endophytica TaxID=714109 RepID=A0A841FRL4_9ACTN|nr:hypothetical protein [Phytomonospora endophytica]MBB6038696.1 hypothetical protein [Phytomonospora endophytica]GIG68507.1 hypothetical protein Pen01_48020 [Phytomonospora endophytica]